MCEQENRFTKLHNKIKTLKIKPFDIVVANNVVISVAASLLKFLLELQPSDHVARPAGELELHGQLPQMIVKLNMYIA